MRKAVNRLQTRLFLLEVDEIAVAVQTGNDQPIRQFILIDGQIMSLMNGDVIVHHLDTLQSGGLSLLLATGQADLDDVILLIGPWDRVEHQPVMHSKATLFSCHLLFFLSFDNQNDPT